MTTKRLGITIVGAVFSALLMTATNASAAYVNCTSVAAERTFGVEVITDDGTASCYDAGTGNINGDDADFAGWTFIDKDQTSNEVDNDFYTTNCCGGAGNDAGLFTILSSLWNTYGSLLVVFKTGNNLDPSWAAFELTPEVLTANWRIVPGQALSHINIYGRGTCTVDCDDDDVPVPEPASMILFGTGLIGIARAAQKRLRTARS